MEPLREVLDDALEKIKDKCFEDDAIEEFEDTLQTYLNLSNSMFREVEQNFIVYMDITVRQFVQEVRYYNKPSLSNARHKMNLL